MKPTLFSKIFLFVLFLSLPLVLASTTMQTDNTVYALGTSVTMSGSCSSPSSPVGLRALLQSVGETVWFDQATSDSNNHFSDSFVPSQKGKYTLTAACQGDSGVTSEICVGTAAECGVSSGQPVAPSGTPPSDGGSSSGGNNGGGGGYNCKPKWQYSEWSYCDANLQQTRTATDLEDCNKKPAQADILRSCEVCEESWSCASWLDCSGGVQTRECYDDHACTTTLSKPATTQTCTESAPLVVQQTTPSKPFFPQIKEKVVSFWDSYMYWIIGIPLAIIILLLLILLLRVLFKKKLVYNEKEVRDWAKKERAAGTMMEDVKQIIGQYTHWDKEKVEQVVNGLK